jgi:hypothetical protein
MRGFVVAMIVTLVLQLHASADACADTPKSTEDAALVHLDTGIAAFDAKDFTTALREFTAAHELVPEKANPYRWLALTEIQLGDCKTAVKHVDAFVARVPASDVRVAEMTRWRDFCARGELQVTGTQGLTTTIPARDDDIPVHRRWWFWPLVGGAAVAITGISVYAVTRSDDTVLPPIHCDASGCSR